MNGDRLFWVITLLFAAACVTVVLKCELGRRVDEVFSAVSAAGSLSYSEAFEYEKEEGDDSDKEKININEAGAEELAELPGIGEVIAGRIVEYREEYGGFESVEEIMEVKGIGEGRFEGIKGLITV